MINTDVRIYPVKKVEQVEGSQIKVLLDLGFGMSKEQEFSLMGVRGQESIAVKDVIDYHLSTATDIMLRSFKTLNGYKADISYRIGEEWLNMSKTVIGWESKYARK